MPAEGEGSEMTPHRFITSYSPSLVLWENLHKVGKINKRKQTRHSDVAKCGSESRPTHHQTISFCIQLRSINCVICWSEFFLFLHCRLGSFWDCVKGIWCSGLQLTVAFTVELCSPLQMILKKWNVFICSLFVSKELLKARQSLMNIKAERISASHENINLNMNLL